MHPNDTEESHSEVPATINLSPKAKKLKVIFERYHLADPYKFSGPVIRFPFHQNGRSIDQVVSGMNSDFERKKLSLYATALPDYGAIDISTKDGPGLEIMREYRLFQQDMPGELITPNRKYCSQ